MMGKAAGLMWWKSSCYMAPAWIVLMSMISPSHVSARNGKAAFVNRFRIPSDVIQVPAQVRPLTSSTPLPPPVEPLTKPDFCHNLDCPDFSLVKKTMDYELRSYARSRWVSTSMAGVNFEAAQYQMFEKLFQYIQGNNVKKEKIAMTAPVLTRIIPGPGPACENNFTMSFYISSSETNPPDPSDKTVFFSKLPQQRVYVGSFGGFATKSSWLKNAQKLAAALEKDSIPFIQDYFYIAGYDSPFKVIGRHNEIWYISKDKAEWEILM